MKRGSWLIVLFLTLPLAVAALDEPPAGGPAAGKRVVEEKCAACHSFEPTVQPDPVALAQSGGPPLFYAGNKFRRAWLERWLAAPTRIRRAGYVPFRYVVSGPEGDRVDESRLPDHPALPPQEAREVADYLATLKKEVNPYPAAQGAAAIRAETHFEKILGCAACHQPRPGLGGLSGPELYTAAERLEREWVSAYLTDPFNWSVGPMPKVSMRGEQLAGIGEYLFQPNPAGPGPAAAPPKAAAGAAGPLPAERAELLYKLYCSPCHGVQGNGKGINATHMFVAPRNHTSFEEMSMLTDDRLFAVIKFGGAAVGKSALMPSWSAVIKDADIHLLIQYLRALSNTRGSH